MQAQQITLISNSAALAKKNRITETEITEYKKLELVEEWL